MSLTVKTLEAAVDTAFAAAGELVVSATLTTNNATGFNWSGQVVTTAAVAPATVEVLFYQDRKEGSTAVVYKALIRTADFPLSTYNQLTIASKVYKIIDYTNHVVLVELELETTSAL